MGRFRTWWNRYLDWRSRPSRRAASGAEPPVNKTDASERDLNKQRLGLSQPPEF